MEIILSNKRDEMLNQLSLMEKNHDCLAMLDLFDQFISLIMADKRLVRAKNYRENIKKTLIALESFKDNRVGDDFRDILIIWKKFIVKK